MRGWARVALLSLILKANKIYIYIYKIIIPRHRFGSSHSQVQKFKSVTRTKPTRVWSGRFGLGPNYVKFQTKKWIGSVWAGSGSRVTRTCGHPNLRAGFCRVKLSQKSKMLLEPIQDLLYGHPSILSTSRPNCLRHEGCIGKPKFIKLGQSSPYTWIL